MSEHEDIVRRRGDENFHPLSEVFPLLEPPELTALVADIRANGVREHIWRDRGGRIIDGRNRWLACQLAGIDCPSRTFEGDDHELVAFVVSQNLVRRHLTQGQRAMIASKLATMTHGGDRRSADIKETAAAARGSDQRSDVFKPPSGGLISVKGAAALLEVAERAVERAREVQRGGTPELVEAVKSGRMPVSTAARVAKEAPERQRDIVAGKEQVPPPRKPVYEGVIPGGVTQKLTAYLHETEPAEPRRVKVQVGETRPMWEISDEVRAQYEKQEWTQSELDRRGAVERGETVVASFRKDRTLIGWAKSENLFVPIDRTSDWGNPFRLDDDGTRDQVIDAYREYYLPHKPSLQRRIHELRGKVLGCHPEPCHGDVLAAAAKQQ